MVEYLSICMSVLKYFYLCMYVCVCMYICIVLCILVGGQGCGLGSIFRLTHTENLKTLPFLSFIMSFFEGSVANLYVQHNMYVRMLCNVCNRRFLSLKL